MLPISKVFVFELFKFLVVIVLRLVALGHLLPDVCQYVLNVLLSTLLAELLHSRIMIFSLLRLLLSLLLRLYAVKLLVSPLPKLQDRLTNSHSVNRSVEASVMSSLQTMEKQHPFGDLQIVVLHHERGCCLANLLKVLLLLHACKLA